MLIKHRGPSLLVCLLAAASYAHASVALLMEEPYGEFGAMNPTGHAAVYFNHICADSPTSLRPCHDGEFGVVISCYHKIDGYDWLAVPLGAYLYAVDSPSDIPQTVDKEQVAALRDAYRKQHLLDLARIGFQPAHKIIPNAVGLSRADHVGKTKRTTD